MSEHMAGARGVSRPTFLTQDILVGDALDRLSELEPGSVDAAFADPPYNLQLEGNLFRPNQTRVDGVDDAWDQFDSFAEYDDFTRRWLALVRRALKPNGTLWVIGSYHNIFRVGTAVQDVGFWILNDVVWVKTNPMPNFRGRRFTNAHETMIWAVADRSRTDYTFNYKSMKVFNDDLQHRSDWTLPICSGPERLRDAEGTKLHPTQKPEALLNRLLLASTLPGDTVLDPFFGSGTTGAVAKRLGRGFIGIEREESYAKIARRRIADVVPLRDVTQIGSEGRPKRIPFGALVEAGHVKVGDELIGGRDGVRARVHVDGSIRAGDHKGSIHKVGAAVRNQAACNGWTYWHIESDDGTLVPIDALRETLRRAMYA
ncbi:DNA methyltransferase [Acuticoccus kandeliae]|uniref:site-specific DNA-methyltransferase n=1 Tax=Acuticoccus kandeliae TaxID=2073160 RepID=UPI000D3E2E80